jgi:hypothetical protein
MVEQDDKYQAVEVSFRDPEAEEGKQDGSATWFKLQRDAPNQALHGKCVTKVNPASAISLHVKGKDEHATFSVPRLDSDVWKPEVVSSGPPTGVYEHETNTRTNKGTKVYLNMEKDKENSVWLTHLVYHG